MKNITTTIFFSCFMLSLLCAQGLTASSESSNLAYADYNMPTVHIPSFDDRELEMHIKQLSSDIVTLRLDSAVKSYINTYTVKKREKAEKMLGRIDMYFPMFEQYARESNVPTDLKYLSVVESALDAHAESRAGAVGLWQFMPATGSSMGLQINRTVDERKDPHKATKAAYQYLKRQYERYDNWELAIAAYNSGPGRVNQAIKRGHSKNFWRIQKYLPKETRNYVPAFIGATYIAHYYSLYNLVPVAVGSDLINTAHTVVRDPYNFQQISEITGTPQHIIASLNPSYTQSLIPYDRNGNNLVLPQADMVRFLDHIGRPDYKLEQMVASRVSAPAKASPDDALLISHVVKAGETLSEIAAQYNQTVDLLIEWNKLKDTKLRPGQRVMLFVQKKPTELLQYQQIEGLNPLPLVNFDYLDAKYDVVSGFIPQTEISGKFANLAPEVSKDYIYYRLKRRETLKDVTEKFPNLTIEELMELNDLDRYSKIKPGQQLIVGEK
jgi:membrane-bound lytic murein transglycosylase D